MVMAKRSGIVWDALSTDYRSRLEKQGITRERYVNGEKLTGARGHGKTPEHPREAVKHPERYPEYVAKRQPKPAGKPRNGAVVNTNAVVAHVRGMFLDALRDGIIGRVDLFEVERRVRKLPPGKQARLLTMNIDQWRRRAAQQTDWEWQVTIDGENVNPFFYH